MPCLAFDFYIYVGQDNYELTDRVITLEIMCYELYAQFAFASFSSEMLPTFSKLKGKNSTIFFMRSCSEKDSQKTLSNYRLYIYIYVFIERTIFIYMNSDGKYTQDQFFKKNIKPFKEIIYILIIQNSHGFIY